MWARNNLILIIVLGSIFLASFLFFSEQRRPDVEPKETLELREGEHYLSRVPEAKYTVVEYFDYDCIFCRKLHLQLAEQAVDYSKINYILRVYPATDKPNSHYKSLIGECIYLQNGDEGYFNFLEGYYKEWGNPDTLDWVMALAKEIVPDDAALDDCLNNNEEVKSIISTNFTFNNLSGITTTPTFVVYKDGVFDRKYVGLGFKLYLSLIDYYSK
jgi:protein-disulfide isomerase